MWFAIHDRTLAPRVTASPPLVTMARKAATQTISATDVRLMPRDAALLTYAAAHTPAVVMPLSPHSEKKIVAKAIAAPRKIRVSFSFGVRTSGLRHIAIATPMKLMPEMTAPHRKRVARTPEV